MTVTVSSIAPRFRTMSTRAVAPAVSLTPSVFAVWNPVRDASIRYVPGDRFAALYAPDSEDTTSVAALVDVLMTLTETPGIAALLVSWMTPVILPRSDCAEHGSALASAIAAEMIAIKCRITMGLSLGT